MSALPPSSSGNASAESSPARAALASRWLVLAPTLAGAAAAVLLFTTSALALWSFYVHALKVLKENLRDGLRSGATVLANTVDPETHSRLSSPEQEKSPEYQQAIARLETVRQALNQGANYRFVYTCIRRDGNVYFVLDPTPEGDADHDGVEDKSHIGDLYSEANPRLRSIFDTGVADVDEEPVVDTWGSALSGYAPIRDASGKVIAVAGVDLELTEFNARINRLRKVAMGGITGAAVLAWLGGVLVKYYQQRLRRSVAAVIGAMSQAQAGERAKSEFLATVSHELRTPLNGIIGMVGLLRETPLNARQREQADTIARSGELLQLIIDDILDWSKIESGLLEVTRIPVNLEACVREVYEWFGPHARQKGLTLAITGVETCPAWFEGDPRHLRQVLMHLTGNALKFTHKGGVTVSVRRPKETPEAEGRLVFTVRDTGIGIPLDQQERIFQPFAQGDSTTTRHYGGTGLGLAISRRLCHAMGGEISVKSTPGEGSEFTFHIRCVPLPPPRDPESGGEPPALTPPAGLHLDAQPPAPHAAGKDQPAASPLTSRAGEAGQPDTGDTSEAPVLLISPDRMLLQLAGLVFKRLQLPWEHRADLASALSFLGSSPCQAILADTAQIGDWQPDSPAVLRRTATAVSSAKTAAAVRLIALSAGSLSKTAAAAAPVPAGFDAQVPRRLRMEDLEAALNPVPL